MWGVFSVVFVAAVIWSTGCSSARVAMKAAPEADLAAYQTYSWAGPADGGFEEKLDKQVRQSAELNLASLGLKEVSGVRPDFYVSYSVQAQASHATGERFAPEMPDVYRDARLTLEFSDARTYQPIWVGTASQTIDEFGFTGTEVNRAVTEILSRFRSARAKTAR